MVGIRRGWAGLLELDPADPETVEPTRPAGPGRGTDDRPDGRDDPSHVAHEPRRVKAADEPDFLQAGRVDDEATSSPPHVMQVLAHLGIDALIPIGGDDTLSFALRLHDEGVPVVAIPKTMDNDVHGTDYCIGFSTAVTRTVISSISCARARGRTNGIAVVEVFGRYSGETSLVSAYLAGMDRAIICEVPFDVEKLATFLMDDKRKNPSRYAMTDDLRRRALRGWRHGDGRDADAYGHRKLGGIGAQTGEALKEITGEGSSTSRSGT